MFVPLIFLLDNKNSSEMVSTLNRCLQVGREAKMEVKQGCHGQGKISGK